MKIRIRELFNKVLFFNKPEENVVKLKIIEEAKYLSIPLNTDVFINDFFNFVPTITTINPNTGILAGGTTITITGTNLTDTSSVTVDGVAATGVTVVSGTSVTCNTPAGSAGAKTITVTTPGGSVSLSSAFTYTNISLFPTITSINPTSGVLAGGTTLGITGTNLTGTSSVTVGGVTATSLTNVSSVFVTAVTPAGATIGLKNITLTTPVGTATSVNAFIRPLVY